MVGRVRRRKKEEANEWSLLEAEGDGMKSALGPSKREGRFLELSDAEEDMVLRWRRHNQVQRHPVKGITQACWMVVGVGLFVGKMVLLRKHRPKGKKKVAATVASVAVVSQPVGVVVNQATSALFYGYPLPWWVRMPVVTLTLTIPDGRMRIILKKMGQKLGKRVIKVKAVQRRLRAWGVRGAEAWAKHKTKLELKTTQTALNDAWNALEQNLPDDVRVQISETEQQIGTFTSGVMGSINGVFSTVDEGSTVISSHYVEEDQSLEGFHSGWGFPSKLQGWLQHGTDEADTRTAPSRLSLADLTKGMFSNLQNQVKATGGKNLRHAEMACFLLQEKGDPDRAFAAIFSTITWRRKFRFMTESELKEWSRFVFLHGRDRDGMSCLYIRLGLAAGTLDRKQMDRFACAIISYAELTWSKLSIKGKKMQGQLSVIVDCQGILPFTIPLKSALYCLIQLDRSYPCLAGKVIIYNTRRMLQPVLRSAFSVLSDNTVSKVYLYGRDEAANEALKGHIGHKKLHALLGGGCHCHACRDILAVETPYTIHMKRRGVKRTVVLKFLLTPLYFLRVVFVFPLLQFIVKLARFWYMFRKGVRTLSHEPDLARLPRVSSNH